MVSFVFQPRAWVVLMVLEEESCPVHPTMKRPNCRLIQDQARNPHVRISLISPANYIFPESTGFPKNHGVQVGIQMISGDWTGNPPIRSGPIPLGPKISQ